MGGLPCCRRVGVAAAREEPSGGGSVRRCCRAVSWGKRVRFVIRTGANGGFGGVLSSGMIIPRGTLARTLPQRARARSPHTIVAGPFPLSPPFCRPPLAGCRAKSGCGLAAGRAGEASTTAQAQIAACRWMRFAPSVATGARPDCSLAAGRVYHAACERKAHAIILRSHAPLRLAHRLPLDIERLLAGFQAFGFKGVVYCLITAIAAFGNLCCSVRMRDGHAS